jgi:chemotaxis protein histidine kinase CheA
MPPNQQDDPFLEEVVGLFALEGQEWLGQIRAAQADLAKRPPPDRASQLCETIRRALASLGGSAATVELTVVEQVSHSLLALVESFQREAVPDASPQWKAFGEGLDALGLGLTELSARGSTAAADLEPVRQRLTAALADPGPSPESVAPAVPQSPSVADVPASAGGTSNLMQALLALRQAPDQSKGKGRVLERLLARLQGDLGRQGAVPDQALVLQVVQELEGQERAFLEKLEQRLPNLRQGLSDLKSLAGGTSVSDEQMGRLIEELDGLKQAAASVEALPVAQFCDGLKLFVGVLTRRRLPILPQRVEQVEARLNEMRRWADGWIEAGRLERTAIQQTLSR